MFFPAMHLSFATSRAERVAPGLGIGRRISRLWIAFLAGILAPAVALAQQPVNFPFQDDTFQSWTVPDTGWYLLDVSGGQGGDASNGSHAGGKGAQIQASVRLTKGEVLRIAVGGQGGKGRSYVNNPSGGGGGGSSSIVRVKNTADPLAPSANDELLLIVGGGGGAASIYAGSPGNAISADGDFGWGGKNGNGAKDSTSNFSQRGAGGAGYLTSGNETDLAQKGIAYLLGNRGGNFTTIRISQGGAGGWGGGGQGGEAEIYNDGSGGGGGGYSGGGSGPDAGNGGGGGGSFVFTSTANRPAARLLARTTGAQGGNGAISITLQRYSLAADTTAPLSLPDAYFSKDVQFPNDVTGGDVDL